MRFVVEVKVVLPDGRVGSFPALQHYPKAVDGENGAIPAIFDGKDEAYRWAEFCLFDKSEIKEVE